MNSVKSRLDTTSCFTILLMLQESNDLHAWKYLLPLPLGSLIGTDDFK